MLKHLSFSSVVGARLKRDPEFRRAYEQRRFIHETAVAVRQMREEAGLTQAELARRIGVSQPVVSRLEKGQDRRAPRFETLRRIGEVLGRKVEVVFSERKSNAPIVLVE
jgi:DNA-binding XRE family transcriptional regulator